MPIVLLAALFAVVFGATSMKRQGRMSEAGFQTLISVSSIAVTIAALTVLFVTTRR